jgi:thioredoxin-like negative regulator of GroEL
MDNEAPEGAARVTELADPVDLAPHLSRAGKTVVFFEISGCPYCSAFEPRFLEFAGKRSGDFNLLRVKLDDPANPLWEKYAIRAVPTVIVFERGEVAARADSVLALGLTKRMWAEFCAGI